MNTTTMMFLLSDPSMYTSPGRTYARVALETLPVCTHTWPYFLSCTLSVVRACTCYMCASTTTCVRSTSTSMYVHVRDQNDNATYASTRWVPTVRHFLACKDVAGGSQQSGGKRFFTKYGGPSGGSLLSGGGIIILHLIRRHFLAAAVDPAVSLSTYSPCPMEAIP